MLANSKLLMYRPHHSGKSICGLVPRSESSLRLQCDLESETFAEQPVDVDVGPADRGAVRSLVQKWVGADQGADEAATRQNSGAGGGKVAHIQMEAAILNMKRRNYLFYGMIDRSL